ncbi:periplasmic binding protein-like I [Entophlyctis helioformis]|nr:periplasmic binding protein-like I [Entophlyctis helioformis]
MMRRSRTRCCEAWLLWIGLAVLLLQAAPTATAIPRAANKAASTIKVTVFGDYFDADQSLLGAEMAAREINARSDILPDVRINVEYNTDYLLYYDPASVYDIAIRVCDQIDQGVIYLELASSMTAAVALVCPHIPSLSFVSGGGVLSNKKLYPLFWRSSWPFSVFIRASLSFFEMFGWSKIGLVYQSTPVYKAIGQSYKEYFSKNGVEIFSSVGIPAYSGSGNYYDQIKTSFEYLKSTKLRIFVVIGDPDICVDIVMAANMTGLVGRDYVWTTVQTSIAASADFATKWGNATLNPEILRGFTLVRSGSNLDASDPAFTAWLPNFQAAVADAIANHAQNYVFMDVLDTDPTSQFSPPNLFYDDPGTNELPADLLVKAYDATHIMAKVWEKWIQAANSDGPSLANRTLGSRYNLKDMLDEARAYHPLSGLTLFTPEGDPVPQKILLGVNTGQRVASFVYAGEYIVNSTTGRANLTIDKTKFVWFGNRSFSDVPIDFLPPVEDYVSWKSPLTMAILVIALLVGIWCLFLCIYLITFRTHKLLRPYAPDKLIVMAFGHLVFVFNVLTLVGKDKPVGCMMRIWPVTIGMVLILVPMTSKAMLLYKIFHHASNAEVINATMLVRILNIGGVAYTLLVVVLLSIQSAIYRLVQLGVQGIIPTTDALYGVTTALAAIPLIAAAVFAYLNREVPSVFNDVKETTNSLTGLTVVFLVFHCQNAFGSSSVTATFAIEALFVLVCMAYTSFTLLGGHVLHHYLFTRKSKTKQIKELEKTKKRMSVKLNNGRSTQSAETASYVISEFKKQEYPTEAKKKIAILEGKQQTLSKRAFVCLGVYLKTWRKVSITYLSSPVYRIRYQSPDCENPDYLSVLSVISVHVMENRFGNRATLVLEYEKHDVLIQFMTSQLAAIWADAICRSLMIRRSPDSVRGMDDTELITSATFRKTPTGDS